MSDFDGEVAAWSAPFKAQRCDRDANVAELEDQLRSEIERLTAEGMPAERAFETATWKISCAADLDGDYDRNPSLASRVHRAFARFYHSSSGGSLDRASNRYTIIGATVILAVAVVLAAVDAAEAGGYLLIVFVPLWLASTGLLGRP